MAPKAASTTTIFLAVSAILLFAFPSAHSAPESSGEGVKYGYVGKIGPIYWSTLSPDYTLCAEGKRQSPINILTNETVYKKNLRPLSRKYHAANASLVNTGYDLELLFEGGELVVYGKKYNLKQLHWHTPAEHLIDGIQYPAELHMVHQAEDGKLAVVGILYKFGKPDRFISRIQGALKKIAKEKLEANETSQLVLGKRTFKLINLNVHSYYRYIGSLTTPPCNENITWNVLTKVRTISPKQVELLKAPLKPEYKKNARPVHPLEGRQVEISIKKDD